MQGLTEVAQRLRQVREAHQRFLALYAVEVAMVEPGCQNLAADLGVTHGGQADTTGWRPSGDDDPARFAGW